MIGPLRALIRIVLLAVSAAALVALPAIPASADASKSVNLACTITSTVDIHPGTTVQPRHVASTSHGFTGTATCTGTVNGQPVTGPGRFLANSHGIASCASSSGEGNFGLRIPTVDGLQTVTGDFAASTTALPSPTSILTGDLVGTSTVVSIVGDCFTTPVTRATAVDTVRVTA